MFEYNAAQWKLTGLSTGTQITLLTQTQWAAYHEGFFTVFVASGFYFSVNRPTCPLTEAVLRDCARVSVSPDRQRQQASRGVPEGGGAQPLPIRHPAGHSAGHPVCLRHR